MAMATVTALELELRATQDNIKLAIGAYNTAAWSHNEGGPNQTGRVLALQYRSPAAPEGAWVPARVSLDDVHVSLHLRIITISGHMMDLPGRVHTGPAFGKVTINIDEPIECGYFGALFEQIV